MYELSISLTRSGPNYSATKCGIIRSNPLAFEETTGQKPNHSHRSTVWSQFGKPKKLLEQNARCDAIEPIPVNGVDRGTTLVSSPFPGYDRTRSFRSLRVRLNESAKRLEARMIETPAFRSATARQANDE